jgi:hypothetical protein
MSFIKLFAAGAGITTVISAAIDVPLDGTITSVLLGIAVQNNASLNAEGLTAEVSFASTPSFTTHDVRNSLGMCSLNFVTSPVGAPGLGVPGFPFFVAHNLEIATFAGERIYLHLQAAGTIDNFSSVGYIHIKDKNVRAGNRRS